MARIRSDGTKECAAGGRVHVAAECFKPARYRDGNPIYRRNCKGCPRDGATGSTVCPPCACQPPPQVPTPTAQPEAIAAFLRSPDKLEAAVVAEVPHVLDSVAPGLDLMRVVGPKLVGGASTAADTTAWRSAWQTVVEQMAEGRRDAHSETEERLLNMFLKITHSDDFIEDTRPIEF